MAQELLKTYRIISDSRNLIENNDFEPLKQYTGLLLEVEARTIKEMTCHDHKYQTSLLVELLHAQEGILPVQIMFSNNKKLTWNKLSQIKESGACYKLNRLVLRPVKNRGKVDVCLGVSSKSSFSLIESPLKSPSVRLIKSQESFKTPNSQSLLSASKRRKLIPVIPSQVSVSSLLCIDFGRMYNESFKFELTQLTQISDPARLDGVVIVVLADLHTQICLVVRDRVTADFVKVYLNFNPQNPNHAATVKAIPLFARVSLINLKRSVSNKLFYYLKGNLDSSDFRVLEPHEAICCRTCPCQWKSITKSVSHHQTHYEGQTFYIPIIHAPSTRIYMSQVSHTVLDRRFLEVRAIYCNFNYVKIECLCVTCNTSRSRRLGQCQDCGNREFKYNLKCCVVLDDHSGVLCEVLCSFTAVARPVLQLTKELMHQLENELVSQDVSELSFTRATLPGELQAHFESDIEPRTLTVIGQLHSPKVAYCRDQRVHLNADSPLGTSYPLPALQAYQVY